MATLAFTVSVTDEGASRIWDAVRQTWDPTMSDKEASQRLGDEVSQWFETIVARSEKAAAVKAAEELDPQLAVVTVVTADKPIDDTKVVVFGG